jgi:hypothetical protein
MSALFPSFPLCIIHDARHITENGLFLLHCSKTAEKATKIRKNENEIALTYFWSSALHRFAGFFVAVYIFRPRLVPFSAFHGVRFRGNCVFGSIVLLRAGPVFLILVQ